EGHREQRERDGDGRGQLVHEEEQQVKGQREEGGQRRSTPLQRGSSEDRQQRTEQGRDEPVAVAHDRRAEQRALQPRESRSAASGGTAQRARYVSPWALACSAARATSTKAITDSGGTSAQRRPRRYDSRSAGTRRGMATRAPWATDSSAIEIQNASTDRQHR